MLDGYRRDTGCYDELVDAGDAVRAHWGALIDALDVLTPEERDARSARLDRRVRETGIAYDIFADPSRSSQRWQLDLLPVVVSAGDWRALSRALVQRATLIDRIVADLYGEQALLRDGQIPAELVFSDSAYLPPCRGIVPRAGPLRFIAFDVARGNDGAWRVMDTHTETLAGVGFALANRMVHTHVTGDLFKQANAIRLASHFERLQAALKRHAGRENARIALLTPGPHHPDYFSHAYVARYLGYLLVEGGDLRTRDGQVHLKTLEGLKRIDLIVRCIDGRTSDPLELDPAGFEGPAGILNICRRTPRVTTNAIGTAIAQNRGLGSYLPGVCRALLGEELSLGDVERHWLGDEVARDRVLRQFERVIVRRAQEGTGRPGAAAPGRDPSLLSSTARDDLRREIALHGAAWVAEEKIDFSTAPAYVGGRLVARPFAMRLFVAHTGEGYEAMPGGLAMSVTPGQAVALTSPDGHTRDVWVLSETEQAQHVSLWRPTFEAARVERSQRVIQSRVADDLFWLGRYSERADWTMRVLRSALRRVEEDSGPATGQPAARKCLEVLLAPSGTPESERERLPANLDIEDLCGRLVAGKDASRTLARTFEGVYRAAQLVRDRLSLEAWQTLSKFRPGDTWTTTLATASPVGVLDQLDDGLAAIAAFNGLMHENMTRNFGWSFLDMGRRLERAYNLAEAIAAIFVPAPEAEEETSSLLLLLELADSFITYRSRYRIDPMLALVLDLLLLDETNPRSLAYQLAALSAHLEGLPDSKQGVSLSDDRRLVLALLTTTRLADVETLAREPNGAELARLTGEQLRLLPELSNAISRHYFNLTDDTPHRLQTRFEVGP